MSEKLRFSNAISSSMTMNSTSSNGCRASGNGNGNGSGSGTVAIGNPTLISSTLSNQRTLTSTVDLINARVANSSPPAHNVESTTEIIAATATGATATAAAATAVGRAIPYIKNTACSTNISVTAQLNSQVLTDDNTVIAINNNTTTKSNSHSSYNIHNSNSNSNNNGNVNSNSNSSNNNRSVMAVNSTVNSSCIDHTSIINNTQISDITNESTLPFNNNNNNNNNNNSNNNIQTPATTFIGGNSMSLVKAGAGKPIIAQSVAGKTCRFPKLEECAHFHYERVQLGPLRVRLIDDKADLVNSSIASQSIGGDIGGAANSTCASTGGIGHSSLRAFSPSNCWFIIKVFPHNSDPFLVKRSFDNVQMLDEMLHRCVYDRKISGLKNLKEVDYKTEEDVEYAVSKYFERFSKIASDSITCGTILTWFQLDNKGRRLPLADGDTMRSINTPAVGAAYGVRRYQAQASDEISIEVGDMISVIDMPSPAESIWWRGKKSHLQKSHYEVGFFPQSCVATIGDKVPRHFPMPAPLVGQLDVSPTKPVLRKHGKLIAFFRSFILSRPSRRRLKQSGIYRERVFSCDLSEHLLNSGQEIPMVLKCCADFIEQYGIVDGIYRLSGITSNIQRLRRAFDEERVPDLGNPEMKQDIHAVSSLLKMYFRELPNPLCTYQLYDNFVEAIQAKAESNERLRLMKETVLKLPPPHYRTLKYLAEHLSKIAQHSDRTGMTDKNLAIVWAPNLLRSPALESGGVAALRGVGVQAVVTEYLIKNCQRIFDIWEDNSIRLSYIATQNAQPSQTTPSGTDSRLDSLTDCESLLVEQREHDQSLSWIERPKSLNTGGPKLISLEEAQERHSKLESFDMKHSMPINMTSSVNSGTNIGSYIEVGGGPSSLPDKYHTVLSVPRSWQKRKTHSWKSLFTRNQQRPVSNGTTSDLKSSITVQARNFSKSVATPVPRHKESTQVTFADTDSIISLNSKNTTKSFLSKRDDKHKSIELFETSRSYCGEPTKQIEVCVRSNSIDSLRTTGHSRSVSHDSYFDLLQSPQRSNVTTCPSRELSELGLNFDREEPEMHIFSESESLVSSPRVGKENIPPTSGTATRRIMRARPEDFSSQTNSVNPSPKKQPRLNILFSPSSAATTVSTSTNWSQSKLLGESECSTDNCYEHQMNESCCKRYKLEDQLSDIQFIDCGTPEHTISNSQTLYTSVQVHGSPQSNGNPKPTLCNTVEVQAPKCKESPKTMNQIIPAKINAAQNTRYSYPTVQLGSKRKDQDVGNISSNVKERFSYPNTKLNSERHLSTKDVVNKMLLEDKGHTMYSGINKKDIVNNPRSNYNNANLRSIALSGTNTAANSKNVSPKMSTQQHVLSKPTSIDIMKLKNRNSYCGASDILQQQLLRSCSAEMTNADGVDSQSKVSKDMEMSKVSVTPSSPIQSPRYSLLMGGDTSSENSSAVNTPQHDLNPLMIGSIMSGISGISAASSNQMHQMLLGLEAMNYLGTSNESLGSNMTDKRDMQALRRELSLDLNPLSIKLTSDSSHLVQRNLPNLMSPNNSNFTDNTSQSVTPSEFGYQNLQRPLSVHSLIGTEDNSPIYEDYENTPSNLNSPMKLNNSPLKSTISITYNLKSPTKEDNCSNIFEKTKDKSTAFKPLLETSFDENTVYEQVKFFRNSVTEVNQLLTEERKYLNTELENLAEVEELSDSENENDKCLTNISVLEIDNNGHKDERINPLANSEHQENLDDILMQDNCLERDKLLLYENVEIRKPTMVYQNLLGEEMKKGGAGCATINAEDDSETAHLLLHEEDGDEEEVELDSLDSIKEEEAESNILTSSAARRSPSNFSVKELASKFEFSPVEQMPAFDFSSHPLRASQKRSQTFRENKPPKNSTIPTGSLKPKLNKNQQQITRSLDENAFVREFGAKTLQDISVRYSQQLPDTTEINSRRKSVDFTKPKTLNPPKRLPGMSITEEVYVKSKNKSQHTLQLAKEKSVNNLQYGTATVANNDYTIGEMKITPTTENRISLIQNNSLTTVVDSNTTNNSILNISSDVSNSNLNTGSTNTSIIATTMANSLIVLSGVKLDRERIDRIKEERRQQLTQKYHKDYKSKSKTDLNCYKNEDEKFCSNTSLRIKSKSRADMRTLQKDMDNLKEFGGRNPPSTAISELTLNTNQQRIRNISDEKNQNIYDTIIANGNTTNNQAVVNNNSKSKDVVEFNRKSMSKMSKLTAAGEKRIEEFSARATVQKFERKSMDFAQEINVSSVNDSREKQQRSSLEISSKALTSSVGRNSLLTNREKISPQFSIRDVTAMFESRSQNQHQ